MKKTNIDLGHIAFITVCLVICYMVGCSPSSVTEEIQQIITQGGLITAGNMFKITPLDAKLRVLSGKEFSINEFKFVGMRNAGNPVPFRVVVSLSGSSSSLSVTETQSATEFETWPENIQSKDITIRYSVVPTGLTYSGKGFLVFYLIDDKNQCVSNIVKWKIEFK